ncbi:MAG: Unknown protein [uncultured Sulfurovum sp.]|uniref:Uncharacterized protein n=1 Tax=uncultured Sulfurovum sp. TaxID=269237 RepID=A0A6S6TFN0_9BACT|nr:MAG: Unknown protein [uncultured Sulfurovum sp.]
MTIEEMKALKVGDTVKDVKRSEQHERKILCEVESIDDNSVTIIALFAKDADAYPHRFFFTRDSEALGLVED